MEVSVEDYEDLIDFDDLKQVDYTPVRGPECFVLVDNLPIVSEERVDKLKRVIMKKLGAYGNVVEDGITLPYDNEKNVTRGFAFVEFQTHEEALNATVCVNGTKLDTKTVLRVISLLQVDSFLNAPDKYEPPLDNEVGDFGHLRSWLGDPKSRDQFAILMRDVVYIYWNNRNGPPDLDCSRVNWTGYYVKWSPLGTYLTTFHDLGVVLWGGPKWEQVCKLEHNGVGLAEYSPRENYIVTWSQYPVSRSFNESHNIALWEIASGKQLKTFQVANTPSSNDINQKGLSSMTDWPRLMWSHDDKYAARIQKDVLYIYSLPNMEYVTGKGLQIDRIKHFSWSPGENIISYWTSEEDNVPAKVNIIKVPSMEVVRTKNLFSVNNVHLYWHSAGDYLVVVIDGIKSKKQTLISVEVFRMKEKDIPIDRIEIGTSVVVSDAYIEPDGSKFVLTVSDSDSSNCNVYKIVNKGGKLENKQKKTTTSSKSKKKKKNLVQDAEVNANIEGIVLLKSIPAREINHITWAPRGGRCVFAGIKENKLGDIRFWDMNELILLGSGEHRGCTSVEWDPTGRYLVSFISAWHSNSDTGFKIWTFTGKLVAAQPFDDFTQFLWRPRPQFLFPEEIGAKVRKNLKEYGKALAKEDTEAERAISEKIINERKSLLNEWNSYYALCVEYYKQSKSQRDELWGFDIDAYKNDKSCRIETSYIEVVDQFISQ